MLTCICLRFKTSGGKAKENIFERVDEMFDTSDRFYSTEQRFYPDGGHESVPFNDPLLDYIIGDDSAMHV